ncbi:PilZ domain-containing protein [Conexibacter sp. SYSU D00693]|uniref:PilZ domain-containing protein n=1 Tax=Conexibacter sp. SYSU D00693 TaxID=2812560 RepID=UPI00196B3768|nr:PilZ domain-containing protein [Conexibacter sp. SYSU D00693]
MRLLDRLRPTDAERVLVHVHGGPVVEAHVSHAVSGAAELVVAGAKDLPPRFLHRRKASLVPVDGDGRLEVTLLAVPSPQGVVRDDVVHAVWLEAQDADPVQRREHARITVVRPVTVVPDGLSHGWLRARTRDVSAGGILLSGVPQLAEGDGLRLLIDLSDQHETQVDVPARVVRATDDGLRALELGEVPEGERDRIAKWVRRRELEALRRLRESR